MISIDTVEQILKDLNFAKYDIRNHSPNNIFFNVDYSYALHRNSKHPSFLRVNCFDDKIDILFMDNQILEETDRSNLFNFIFKSRNK
jgi:hypothetical protein